MVIATLLVVVSAVASMTSADPIFNLYDSTDICEGCKLSSDVLIDLMCTAFCGAIYDDTSSEEEEEEEEDDESSSVECITQTITSTDGNPSISSGTTSSNSNNPGIATTTTGSITTTKDNNTEVTTDKTTTAPSG